MIITLTMNPAIDKTVEVPGFQLDQVNRVSDMHLDAAGKGINIAKVVKALGGHTKTLAFLGGKNGFFIEEQLKRERISLIPVAVDGETRVNVKVVDPQMRTYTDINEAGPLVTMEQLKSFEDQLIRYATSQSIVVLTGSVPPGVSKSVYREMINRLKSFGVKTVLDASGELFSRGLESGPMLVKPNHHELERFAGRPLKTDEEIIDAGMDILKKNVEIVVISLGERGAFFLMKDKTYHAKGLKVDVKSTVGAGDAMVAGLCYGIQKNIPLEETFALSVACSAAQVSVKGTQPPDLDKIYHLIKHVEIKEYRRDK